MHRQTTEAGLGFGSLQYGIPHQTNKLNFLEQSRAYPQKLPPLSPS